MNSSSTLFGFSIFGIVVTSIIAFVVLIIVGIISIPKLLNLFTYIFLFFKSLFMNNDPVISDVCALFPILGSSSRVPSLYMAHIAFFVGFLFTNAYTVYILPSDNLNPQNLQNRKFRALITMIILVLIYLISISTRLNLSLIL